MLLVTFFPPAHTRNWARQHKLPYRLASDESRQAYLSYGLREGTTTEIIGPQNWVAGARAVIRTRTVPTYTKHVNQLGGYFIVSSTGDLLYAYASQASADYPPVGELLRVLGGK